MTNDSPHSDTVAMNETSNSHGNSDTPVESEKGEAGGTDKKKSRCVRRS